MGELVLVYGKSGSGKSRSMKFFAEDEAFLVNVERKALPFRGHFKYVFESDNIDRIKVGLKKMPTKVAVIDDAGYLITNQFMRGHSGGKKGASVFDLYNDLADSFWGLFKFIKDELPKDVIVYVMMHEDTADSGLTRLKTIGKLLDDKVCLEGMVTVCLRCMSNNGKHYFRTQTDGLDISKSPEDMFADLEIDNNLKAVDTAIRSYYHFNTTEEENENESN